MNFEAISLHGELTLADLPVDARPAADERPAFPNPDMIVRDIEMADVGHGQMAIHIALQASAGAVFTPDLTVSVN